MDEGNCFGHVSVQASRSSVPGKYGAIGTHLSECIAPASRWECWRDRFGKGSGSLQVTVASLLSDPYIAHFDGGGHGRKSQAGLYRPFARADKFRRRQAHTFHSTGTDWLFQNAREAYYRAPGSTMAEAAHPALGKAKEGLHVGADLVWGI